MNPDPPPPRSPPSADPSAVPSGDSRPTPGEVVRPAQRMLERPPSERYGALAVGSADLSGSVARVLIGAVGPATIGAALLVLLGSPLAVSEPLVVVALLAGLVTGVGARLGGGTKVAVRRRRALAIGAALAAVAVAEIVVWQLALVEGGVLSFLDYQWLVFGPTAVLEPLAAGLAAWATA